MTSSIRKKKNKAFIKENFLFKNGDILEFIPYTGISQRKKDEYKFIVIAKYAKEDILRYKLLIIPGGTALILDKKFVEERYCKI